jgi:hypothetical protein
MDDVYERFLSLAKRELSADDVRLLALGEAPPAAENVLVARLRDGRHVVASFGNAPREAEVMLRRLEMLAGTFADALEEGPASERTRSRRPAATSLHDELKVLAERARAVDVVVIDGDSPVVWGCASVAASPRARNGMLLRDVSDRELSSYDEPSAPAGLHAVPAADDSGPSVHGTTAPTGVLRMAPPPESSRAMMPTGEHELAHGHDHATDEEEPELTRAALAQIRALPSLALLHKGKHVRELSRTDASFLVLSFSGIYLLCLVFDGEFDELRAERAAHESLPRIERLVLALPPLVPDPQPTGGVVALRRSRRR